MFSDSRFQVYKGALVATGRSQVFSLNVHTRADIQHHVALWSTWSKAVTLSLSTSNLGVRLPAWFKDTHLSMSYSTEFLWQIICTVEPVFKTMHLKNRSPANEGQLSALQSHKANQHDQYHKYTGTYHHLRIQGTFSVPGVSPMSSYLCTYVNLSWPELYNMVRGTCRRLDLGGLGRSDVVEGVGGGGEVWPVGRETDNTSPGDYPKFQFPLQLACLHCL